MGLQVALDHVQLHLQHGWRALRRASAPAAGHADLPGRLGDPGDGRLSAAAATAAASAGAGTRLKPAVTKRIGPGAIPGRFVWRRVFGALSRAAARGFRWRARWRATRS